MAANGAATSSNELPGLFGRRDPVFRPWPLPGREPTDIAEFVQQLKTQGIEFRALTEDGLREEIAERARRKQASGAAGGGDDAMADDADSQVHADDEADEADDDDDDDDDDGAGGATEADTGPPRDMEAMMTRRDDVLRTLESALQSGLIAVDFVSLLLSKDRPTQAMQTLSPLLREKVGIGTLSAGRIANAAQAARALQLKNNSNGGGGSGSGSGSGSGRLTLDETTRFNAQRLLDHKTECVGWQLLAMDRTADILAAARRRLHAELRREERYWAEVVAVRDRGWGLSRLPGQRRVLRVKFGFSEAAADLSAGGFAPLRRVKRGHVELDMSALGPPAALVVTLRRRRPGGAGVGVGVGGGGGGSGSTATEDAGRSRTPPRLPRHAPLEDRILEARNTIYAKELWRELNREARALVSHAVIAHDAEIVFPVDAHTDGVITLVPLRPPAAVADLPPFNDQAEAIAAALHIFLSHGHRQRYRQRSVPTPPTDRTGVPSPTYFALRPVIAHHKYEAALTHLAALLSDLCTLIHSVGHTGARFRLYERPLSASLSAAFAAAAGQGSQGSQGLQGLQGPQKAASELLCASFLDPREFSFELDLAPALRLAIRSRTTVVPLKTQYLVHLLASPPDPVLPAAASEPSTLPSPHPNPLAARFPPADHYSTLRDVVAYVSAAAAHMLAADACRVAHNWEARAGAPAPGVPWATAADGMGVHQRNNALWNLRFAVVPQGTTTALDRLITRERRRAQPGHPDVDNVDNNIHDHDAADADADADAEEATLCDDDSPLQPLRPPELRLYASWPVPTQPESATHRKWTWTVEAPANQESNPTGGAAATDDPSPVLQDVLVGCISGELRPAVLASTTAE